MCSLFLCMELTPHQKKLAYEIASTLGDLSEIAFHEELVAQHSESFLREKLAYVLSRNDIDNRAGYYIRIVTGRRPHGKKKYSRP